MPTMAAMCYKYSIGQPFVYPRNDLSYAGNFQRMEQTGNLLMDHGVTGHGGFKFIVLSLRRFFAVQQDVAHFQIVGFGG